MSIFRKYFTRTKLAFAPIDPLGDGLREMIRLEQQRDERIDLYDENYDASFWEDVDLD